MIIEKKIFVFPTAVVCALSLRKTRRNSKNAGNIAKTLIHCDQWKNTTQEKHIANDFSKTYMLR